jgi:DNA-binding transcriptional MerR regulator
MKVSLNKASKDNNISLPTLSRWRKKGLISAEKNENGGYLIDTSEYDRINELKKQSPNVKDVVNSNTLNFATPYNTHESKNETPLLRLEIEMLKQRLLEKDEFINDLKIEKEDWKKQAQTLLLQAPQKPAEARKGFLARLISKSD